MKKETIEYALNDFLLLWNKEFPNYNLTSRLMKEKILEDKNVIFSYSLYAEEFIGLVVVKKDLIKKDKIYISLIYVNPKYRFQNYGNNFLNEIEKYCLKNKYKEIFLGSDFSCLFSGLFLDNNEEIHNYFIRHGYSKVYKCFNLLCDEKINTINSFVEFLQEKNIFEFDNFLKKNFSERWLIESRENNYQDIIVIRRYNKIIAFCRISTLESYKLANGMSVYPRYNSLATIGPLGVDKDFRGLGFGSLIIKNALNYLQSIKKYPIIVDWTGLIDFYSKFGFTKICDSFIIYKKDILEDKIYE